MALLLLVAEGLGGAGRPIRPRCSAALADTGLDLIASMVTLFGVRVAAQPADREHRFGHGKAEALAAMFQVVLISLSAVGIAFARRSTGCIAGGAVAACELRHRRLGHRHRRHVRAARLPAPRDPPHRPARDQDRQRPLQVRPAAQRSVIAALVLDHYLGIAGADPLFGLAHRAVARVGRVARVEPRRSTS